VCCVARNPSASSPRPIASDPQSRGRLRAVHAASSISTMSFPSSNRERTSSRRGEAVRRGHRLGEEGTEARLGARAAARRSATGSSPGFITDALPFALLSLQRRVESVEIEEFANMSRSDSPHMIFEQMKFRAAVASFDPKRSRTSSPSSAALAVLAEAAAGPPPSGRARRGRGRAPHDVAGRGRAPGRVRRTRRTTIVGTNAGLDVVRFTANWYCTTDVSRRGISGRRAGGCVRERRAPTSTSVPGPARRISGRSRPRTPRTGR
jgi:4-hydroxy-tetrahydrodipicolinate reductase